MARVALEPLCGRHQNCLIQRVFCGSSFLMSSYGFVQPPPPKKNGEQCQWYFRKPRMTPTSNHPAQYFGMWFPNFFSPFGIQRLHCSATIRGLLTFHRNTWLWRPKRLWCVWSWNASELQAFVSQLWSTSPAARRAYAKNLRSSIWHLCAVGSECNSCECSHWIQISHQMAPKTTWSTASSLLHHVTWTMWCNNVMMEWC